MPTVSWPSAASPICLGSSEIHLWCALLRDFHAELSRFEAVLSAHERARAGRFHFAVHRRDFVICRGILRELLAGYLRKDVSAIEFSYGRHGKPEIAGRFVQRRLHFNASRSAGVAVYAVTAVSPIGVDVERVHAIQDFEEIASRFFDPRELDGLRALPPERRTEHFFTTWTSMEAVQKATGDGLGNGLTTRPSSDWHLQRLSPASGYVAAIAYRHQTATLSCRNLVPAGTSRRSAFTGDGQV